MIKNVVIVEDDRQCADKLSKLISRFFNEAHLPFSLKVFNSSLEALELAKKIREKDEKVIIIFCSNLAQFALKGYEVGAFDYIVKPFDYSNIAHRLNRALNVDFHRQSEKIILKVASSENIVIDQDSIIYIEKERNYLVFHTAKEAYWVRGSLQEYEKILPRDSFSYSKKGVYVNASIPPSTAPGEALLRVSLMATHTKEQVDEAVEIIAETMKEFPMEE